MLVTFAVFVAFTGLSSMPVNVIDTIFVTKLSFMTITVILCLSGLSIGILSAYISYRMAQCLCTIVLLSLIEIPEN